MKIDKIVVGDYQTNCYVLTLNNNCIVIDPGDDYEKIQEKVGNKNIKAIIITHYHFDHVGALNNFKSKIIDYKYKDGFYKINDFEFNIIHTPGHKEDCITIYFEKEKIMFTGDFIFKNSIGRTDLGGNTKDMIESINKIKHYDDSIIIYPGHGEYTTLSSEKENNEFFNTLH